MNVGIIGAGNVGRAVASAAAKAGQSVSIASPDPDDARKTATETGARALHGNELVASNSVTDAVGAGTNRPIPAVFLGTATR